MGKNYNPKSITRGLICYLDVANKLCYTGAGITANGLISGIGMTLVNGTGFSSSNLGSFFFDGTNDHMPFYIPGIGNTITVEMWAKINSFELGMPFGFNFYDVFCYQGSLGFNTGNSDQYGVLSSQISGLGISSKWTNYHFEMRSDVSYTNNKVYINGELQNLQVILAGESSSNRNFNSGVGRISGWNANTNFALNMNMSIFKMYNRSLSQIEIIQNFRALKGRFGL